MTGVQPNVGACGLSRGTAVAGRVGRGSMLPGLVVACGFSFFLRLLVTWLQRESKG